jgi:hypothetical protein
LDSRFPIGLGSAGRTAEIHFPSASLFSFAQSLSRGTAFRGGPPVGPQAQTPPVLAMVMQEHDLVFKQAQT